MAKPVVYLFTRDDCRPCRCGLARNLLKELTDKNRCDGAEYNLSKLDPDDPAIKYARARGFSHFPTFLVCHPERPNFPIEKIWADDNKKWDNGEIRRQLNAALDRIWRMR
jgi:hypothetical protein